MKKFLSFVFPETIKKQIGMMPPDMRLRFYEIVTDYGMYGTEPSEMSGMEGIVWVAMKDLLDSCKGDKGGAPVGNNNASKKTTAETQKQPKTTENNQNNPKTTETTLNNGNGNGNGNEEGEGEDECKAPSPSFSEPQQNYARIIFEKFRDAGLPCQKGNEFSFMSCDFKNALQTLKGMHSDDVIQAVDNYISVLKDPGSYVTHEYSFDAFVRSKTFINCLPTNFVPGNFKSFGKTSVKAELAKESEEKEKAAREAEYKKLLAAHPSRCECGAELVDSSGTGRTWFCRSCEAEYVLRGGQWVRDG